uniref:Uncharacterized protein n=1 Tax=Arundo donax TaxID=35708 RepID=A0A0A9EEW7_ARUDO
MLTYTLLRFFFSFPSPCMGRRVGGVDGSFSRRDLGRSMAMAHPAALGMASWSRGGSNTSRHEMGSGDRGPLERRRQRRSTTEDPSARA